MFYNPLLITSSASASLLTFSPHPHPKSYYTSPFKNILFKEMDCQGCILLSHAGFDLFAAFAAIESYGWKYVCSFQMPLIS